MNDIYTLSTFKNIIVNIKKLFMDNVVDLNVKRRAIAEVCGRCAHADFCIVDDHQLGHIVVCQNCGGAIGRLVFNEYDRSMDSNE